MEQAMGSDSGMGIVAGSSYRKDTVAGSGSGLNDSWTNSLEPIH